ncbi:MAG: FAD binding domain-containing protein, partial [Candidatus Bipolaricaulia bacterium]
MGFDQVESLVRPSSLKEAWEEKAERGEAARFLGGGTDLALFTPTSVRALIDLAPLELSYVRGGESGIEVGATTTMTDVIESPQIASYAGGFVQEVLRQVASPL